MGAIINIESEYFRWLQDKFRGREYENLFYLMYDIPFEVYNPMDNNRVENVSELRDEFLDTIKGYGERLKMECAADLMSKPASLLEVLCELCIKINNDIFYDPTSESKEVELFWQFIDNVVRNGKFGSRYMVASQILSDDKWDAFVQQTCKEAFDQIIKRKFRSNGAGGFFPCSHSDIDQRKCEMWTACMAYVREKYKI